MSTPVIAFFNNKGGVGKTSLVYHLTWMCGDLGLRVVAADLDPQANLTTAFLDEDRLEDLWKDETHRPTVFGAIQPLLKGTGDVATPHLEAIGKTDRDKETDGLQPELPGLHLEDIDDRIALLVGDLSLSRFEDQLAEVWPKCNDGDERAFRVMSAFWRVVQEAAKAHQSDVVLMDLGPNLGSINRAALIAAHYVVVPLSPDLFSLQGLRNLGPQLRRWRQQWRERLGKNPISDLPLPEGGMEPVGYIVLQHSERMDRPVKAYQKWIARIPGEFRVSVLGQPDDPSISIADDPYRLPRLKHYRSLMPMAQEVRKPMFHLKPADGAIGAHAQAVLDAYQDFKKLAFTLAERTDLPLAAQESGHT